MRNRISLRKANIVFLCYGGCKAFCKRLAQSRKRQESKKIIRLALKEL